jgi:hypothetical protein
VETDYWDADVVLHAIENRSTHFLPPVLMDLIESGHVVRADGDRELLGIAGAPYSWARCGDVLVMTPDGIKGLTREEFTAQYEPI